MGYVVEDVSIQDRQKILADVANMPNLVKRFGGWLIFRDPTGPFSQMRWAIDRVSGNYLFRSGSFARELENGYHFFFEGCMYQVGISGMLGAGRDRLASVYPAIPSEDETPSDELKRDLTAAFSVYGLIGYGECREDGTPAAYGVVPVFGKGA